ncbi:MAG TPA: PAS domain-containing protein [bacterium]|nr:PAS domain-containing protein [bacterium]
MFSKEIDTRSQGFANSIIDTIREPLLVLDRDLRIISAGRSFFDVFKVKHEETIGRLVYDLGDKQWDIPKLRELLETIIPDNESFDNYEVQHEFPHIGKRTMLLNARRIPAPPAKIDTILLTIEDITARKLAESTTRMATVLRDSNDAITLQDIEGNITAWNKGAERIFGYSEQEALQMKVWRLVPPDKEAEQKDFNLRLFAGEKVSSFETQRLTKDGRLLDMWLTVTKLMDDTGKVVGIAATERDITERKWAEETLRESEARYRALFDGAAEGILVADLQMKQFRYANPALCRMFGYTEEELTRLGVADTHPKGSLDHVLAEFEAQARGEKTLATDLPCLRKDGTMFYADVSAALTVLDGHECNVGFFADVTERKRAERELKDQLEHIKRSSEIMFGREGRVVEIKQEVNALLKELGRPAKYMS